MKIREYLKKYAVKPAIAALVCALLIIIASSALGGRAGVLSDAVGAMKAPVQKAASAMVEWLEGAYGYLFEYDRIVAENASLRRQIAELQEQARSYDEVNEENERLRRLLDLRDKHSDFDFESSKIVSWDASNYSSAFTLSKGESSGIELGDCVVTEYGALVGQVIELGENWATVRTVIDVGMDVGVLVGSSGYAGMISGEFSLMRDGLTRVTYLASGSQIFEEDEVLTSGAGGSFPLGLLVGSVKVVMTEAGGQNTYGVIEPACDLDSLSQVFVIKDFDIVE